MIIYLVHAHSRFGSRRLRTFLLLACMTILGSGTRLLSQSTSKALPVLVKAEVPRYPFPDRVMGIQGTIRMRVQTAGTAVQQVTVLSDGGHPVLASAAEANIRSWEFQKHDHAAFDVTYKYLLRSGSDGRMLNAVLRLPVYVEVIAPRWPRGEPDRGQEIGPPSK